MRIGNDTLSAKKLVIATGAEPMRLGIPGEHLLTTSDQFLDLDRLPASIVFAGGGYIAMEFAHVAARAGAKVTILHRGQRPLDRFDPELVQLLVERTQALGIDLLLRTTVESIAGTPGNLRVSALAGTERVNIEAELVVHAAGRQPDLAGLDLETAQVEFSARGVTVNEFLQSVSNDAVYAAGDASASGGAPLTPVAGYEGRIVAENLLHGNRKTPDYSGLASVAFTIPPIASVGLTEEGAKKRNASFTVRHGDTRDWYSSRRIGEECSGYKILIEEESGRILGAHLIGDRAEELINVFALAIRTKLRAEDVKAVLYAYPTHGSDIQYML